VGEKTNDAKPHELTQGGDRILSLLSLVFPPCSFYNVSVLINCLLLL
jgi:hypothetical protein